MGDYIVKHILEALAEVGFSERQLCGVVVVFIVLTELVVALELFEEYFEKLVDIHDRVLVAAKVGRIRF